GKEPKRSCTGRTTSLRRHRPRRKDPARRRDGLRHGLLEEALMIHPNTELCWISAEIGHGVRATRRIVKGTLTWVRCSLDRVLTRAELDALGPQYRPIVERY